MITEVDEIKKRADTARRIVFVSGNFNIVHPGHLRLLRFAAECGDYLVVGVTDDSASGVLISSELRLESIRAISLIDYAFVMTKGIKDIIRQIKPAVVVKGKEHENLYNPETEILQQYGGNIIFTSGETIFSSVDLITKEFKSGNFKYIELPEDYLNRHQIHRRSLLELIDKFKDKKICIIGDLIIDEYITCEPLGMSQEDPTIVVTPINTTKFIGGAGIVAGHAAGLGASVTFISISGDDPARDFAIEGLIGAGVNQNVIKDVSRPTTIKQRFRSKGKTLLRVSHLHSGNISTELQTKILSDVKNIITNIDMLIFSDFNYGCLPQALVESIIKLAKQHEVLLAADSQSSSQIGNISRFRGMNLLTPTEREARISMRNQEDGLVVLADQLRSHSTADNIILKLGGEGLIIHSNNLLSDSWHTDRIVALNSNPKDVAGAGDSLLITSSLALCCGGTIWEAACLGSIAAAIQVGRVGNTPLKSYELKNELM